jgi:hypothetical protein
MPVSISGEISGWVQSLRGYRRLEVTVSELFHDSERASWLVR